MDLLKKLEESAKFIKSKTELEPEIGLILGSGLSSIADILSEKVIIPFSQIPNFIQSTVEGHRGEVIIGRFSGKKVFIMAGRLHYYEGHSIKDITYPVRLMKCLCVKKLILTSAVGAVNKKYKPGDIMLIKDHINFMGCNPLVGLDTVSQGERFPDMTSIYEHELIKKAELVAKKLEIRMHKGVYIAFSGPSYETPAEVKMIRKFDADVVGMSTVPEAIVANYCGIKVLGISYISNMAAGILRKQLNHKEVLSIGKKVETKLTDYIKEIIKIM
ncbi:MAG: purine-nucleoside phosphorylase [Elusimicrobia bacterium RIFOXYC2_FULL_34_12]|nr:MAG: purine-nucleoside phosphorylase [Elusimicrobia bacterium RIFOXYC2_FULL_34_12]OGS38919.1 MAG: purine-nucleoside phosphorylase [Elusimicrobia bacterium RIFOXYD2_FULL_34_30]